MDGLLVPGIVIITLLLIAVFIGFMLSRLYRRATKERAYVRTGSGGQKVIKDGGAIILPVLHEIMPVNMQTLRLEVKRNGPSALITKDSLRVDVTASFFVRVKPDNDNIATAAQTLGLRTLDPSALSSATEDKFVDALRSVAAGMEMRELHEQRAKFVQSVRNAVAEDLSKNGLELESVSLTGLDQTPAQHLNSNNAFDAEGLTKLAKITQDRARERNEIEVNTRVAIEQRNLEADQQSLEISQTRELARLEQEQRIGQSTAEQAAALARLRAEQTRIADVARIEADRATREAQIANDQQIKSRQIEADQVLEIARQSQQIQIAEKSEDSSKAQSKADDARALAVAASESVKTAEATAAAERVKRVALIQAEQEAERSATSIRVQASADLEAAENRAKARTLLTEAEAKELAVRAEGQTAINNAANMLTPAQIEMQIKLELIRNLPQILGALGEPMKHIDSLRVVHMSGGMNGGQAGQGSNVQSDNLPNNLANAALNYQMQVPLVTELGRTLGMDLTKGMGGVMDALQTNPAPENNLRPLGDDDDLDPKRLKTLAGIDKQS